MNTNLIIVILIVVAVLFGLIVYKNVQANKQSVNQIINQDKSTNMDQNLSQSSISSTPNVVASDQNKKQIALVETSLGNFELELFTTQMPITTGNFIKLAKEGFYDGTLFHRVIPNFMVQGGDPLTKKDDASVYGTGGPGYNIKDEFVAGLSNVRGTIAMANSGRPDSGGSQFFINVVDNTFLDFDKEPLTSKHPVFGKIIKGMEVVDKIVSVPTAPGDRPLTPVKIIKITFSS